MTWSSAVVSCRVGQSVGRRVVVSSFFRFFLRCFERVSRRRQPINVDAEKDEKKNNATRRKPTVDTDRNVGNKSMAIFFRDNRFPTTSTRFASELPSFTRFP